MADSIDALKNEVFRYLGTSTINAEAEYASVSKGLPIFVAIIVLAISLLLIPYTIGWAGIIFLLYDQSKRADYNNARLKVLARLAAEKVAKEELQEIRSFVERFSIRSLREKSWSTAFSIIFPGQNGASFSYRTSSDYPFEINGSFADLNGYAVELCPGLFAQYNEFSVSLKCDFRVIRTPLGKYEITNIFRAVSNALEGIPATGISIHQYSSTKSYYFTASSLESGVASYINNKSRQSNLKISNFHSTAPESKPGGNGKELNSFEVEQTPPKPRKMTEHKQPTGAVGKRDPAMHVSTFESNSEVRYSSRSNFDTPYFRAKRTLVELDELLERRKNVELKAMQVVRDFEWLRGRKTKDVSSQNLGYDILSEKGGTEKKKIEVKGLSGSGDVILTENEMRIATEEPDAFWLYVVDNCFEKDSVLHVLQDVTFQKVSPLITAYEIEIDEQVRCSTEIYKFRNGKGDSI